MAQRPVLSLTYRGADVPVRAKSYFFMYLTGLKMVS